MNRRRFCVIFAIFASFSAAGRAGVLCPSVIIEENVDLGLSDTEKRLVCGDEGSARTEQISWSRIPPAQAQVSMKAFLQDRGYDNPVFTQQGAVLHVKLGPPTLINKVTVEGAPSPGLVSVVGKRLVVGEKLTPAKLNELEQWAELDLRFHGYPCPKIKSQANRLTGEVRLIVDAGPKQKIVKVTVSDDLGLQPGTLRRYDAFQVGEYFNARDVTITERRIVNEDIVSTAHFLGECGPQGAVIRELLNGGPPRSFRIGVGVDTEQYVLGSFAWRHARLDNRASNIEVSGTAGYRTQQIQTNFNWFYSGAPRDYLRPSFTVQRQMETFQETNSIIAALAAGKTWDETQHGWLAEAGPTWRFDNTVVGVGPQNARNLLITGKIQVISHDFEYYQTAPQEGFKFYMDGNFSNRAWLSAVSAQRLYMTGEWLWNFRGYDPPLFVLGWRAGFGTTFSDVDLNDPALPPAFRHYLGGNEDIRGFNRQELPSALGALTFLFTSFEGRFVTFLPYHFQPFIFIDAGEMGSQPMTLTYPLYWSPGIGLRWESPIGVLRANVAHGFLFSPPDIQNGVDLNATSQSHWQLYFSYGEEF